MKKFISAILILLCVFSFTACQKKQNTAVSVSPKSTLAGETVTEKSNEASTSSAEKNGKKNSPSTTKKGETTKKSSSVSDKKNSTTTKKSSQPTANKKTTTQPEKTTLTVKVTIDYTQALSSNKKPDNLSGSGYFLNGASVELKKGSSAYSALQKACSNSGISLLASQSMYGVYISSIGHLAEKDCGSSSGWLYTVNGNYPSKSSDKYTVSDGDNIKFIYKV